MKKGETMHTEEEQAEEEEEEKKKKQKKQKQKQKQKQTCFVDLIDVEQNHGQDAHGIMHRVSEWHHASWVRHSQSG
jgi:hypothetical protein